MQEHCDSFKRPSTNKGEVNKFLEFNENKNTTYQRPCDTAKAVLRGKFIAKTAYIKNTERVQINNLMLQLKHLERKPNPKK
jgi:hypothetical protein